MDGCNHVIQRECCRHDASAHSEETGVFACNLCADDAICPECGREDWGAMYDAVHEYRERIVCERPAHPPMVPDWPHEKWTGHEFRPAQVREESRR